VVGVPGHLLGSSGSAAACNRKRGSLNYWRSWRSSFLQFKCIYLAKGPQIY